MLLTFLLKVWTKKADLQWCDEKEPNMTKEETRVFKNCPKYWVCDIGCADGDVKVRYYCHITGKYRCCAHEDCNIYVKLNQKTHVVFHTKKLWFTVYCTRAREIQF